MDGTVTIQEAVLSGIIRNQVSIIGAIVPSTILIGSLSTPIGYNEYSGPYVITPLIHPQSLDTDDKHLNNDITIEAIPYHEVHNLHGGVTVTIGRS